MAHHEYIYLDLNAGDDDYRRQQGTEVVRTVVADDYQVMTIAKPHVCHKLHSRIGAVTEEAAVGKGRRSDTQEALARLLELPQAGQGAGRGLLRRQPRADLAAALAHPPLERGNLTTREV